LGSFDEDTGKWQCDDHCLEEDSDGQLCGDVDHLTNFALLLSGNGGSGCGSSAGDYILGSAWNDFYLIISVSGFVVILSCFIILLGVYFRPATTFIGRRGPTKRLTVVDHSDENMSLIKET